MNLFRFLKQSDHSKKKLFNADLAQLLPGKPQDPFIYEMAFSHPAEQKVDQNGENFNYQRLEFLGDALIGSITAKYLFDQFPHANEGQLTKLRAKIVSRKTLNFAGKNLKLKTFLSTRIQPQHYGKNIAGNLFEALTGAIYCDMGYMSCNKFIEQQLLKPYAQREILEQSTISYKNTLIEQCQKKKLPFSFRTEAVHNNHKDEFCTKIYVNKKLVAEAQAESKKDAEELAAKKTLSCSGKAPN